METHTDSEASDTLRGDEKGWKKKKADTNASKQTTTRIRIITVVSGALV